MMEDVDFLNYEVPEGYICGVTKRSENFTFSYHIAEREIERKKIRKGRNALLKLLSFSNLITLNQIHSGVIHLVNSRNLSDFVKDPLIPGDGLITDLPDLLLGISTADCIPVVYLSEGPRVCGIIHAGWRGISRKIHTEIIRIFNDVFHIAAEKIRVIIGPHIRSCCYEVKEDMMDVFGEKYFEKRGDKYYLNLEKILVNDILNAGIMRGKIFSLPFCSYCSNEFLYSYRRGEKKGRNNLTFVGIKK